MEKEQISKLLIQIGLNPSYRAYPYLLHIIAKAVSDENGPFLTSKVLYEDASLEFHVSTDAIQHAIRTLLNGYWKQINHENFNIITGYPHIGPMPPREFIAVITDYLRRNSK